MSGGAPAPDPQRAKQAFLSHMRHELRTPVNAILGYSELILEDHPGSPFRGDVERIHAAGREILDLIGALLDPARVEAIDGAQLAALGPRIRHELRTPTNTVIGYAEMLLEDVSRLPEAIREDVAKVLAAGRRLMGMLDDVIGLARAAAGSVDAALPGAQYLSMIEEVVASIRPLAAGAERPAREDGARILVVDDNEVNRDVLCRRLRREGYAATPAEDGAEALQVLAERPFDLVLLDVMMPGLNGYQVLEALKADARLRHVPVIMISALEELDSVVRCIESGAEDYLTKPFNPVILKARLSACLEKKRLRDLEVSYLEQIEAEKRKSDELLRVILPDAVVEELKASGQVRPRRFEAVAVLFCDIVGFTPFCATRQPEEVVALLQELVSVWEEIAARQQLLKIKTIGDSFMASAGLLAPLPNPTLAAVRCGLEMLEAVRRMPTGWDVRVGIHVGPVTAGVIGRRTYLYDLWGDTVNTAARIESHGQNGAVNLSAEAWRCVAAHCTGGSLGRVALKGLGEVEIYQVTGLQPPPSS
jgi:class 3 adenylate cyclase